MICHNCTLQHGCQRQRNVHPCIVVQTIVIHETPHKIVLSNGVPTFDGLAPTEVIRGLHVLLSGKEIVHFGSDPEVGELVPIVNGYHDGEMRGQMGCNFEERFAFVKGLPHKFVLSIIKFLPSILGKLGRVG